MICCAGGLHPFTEQNWKLPHHFSPNAPPVPRPRPPLRGVERLEGGGGGGASSSGSGSAFFFGSGRACKALRERLIRCASVSTDKTFTSTAWPSETMSLARKTRVWASSLMWINPSTPASRRTNAPNSVSFETVPLMREVAEYLAAAVFQGFSERSRYDRLIFVGFRD